MGMYFMLKVSMNWKTFADQLIPSLTSSPTVLLDVVTRQRYVHTVISTGSMGGGGGNN